MAPSSGESAPTLLLNSFSAIPTTQTLFYLLLRSMSEIIITEVSLDAKSKLGSSTVVASVWRLLLQTVRSGIAAIPWSSPRFFVLWTRISPNLFSIVAHPIRFGKIFALVLVIQFLMRLNEAYNTVRRNVIMMNPPLNLKCTRSSSKKNNNEDWVYHSASTQIIHLSRCLKRKK